MSRIDQYKESYVDLFGEMPEVPGRRFAQYAEVSPRFVEAFEALRAEAFYSGVFDVRTTQLIAFASLLRAGHFAAYWHARAAMRAGATEAQIAKVIEITVATDGGMKPIAEGGAILERLRQDNA